MHLGPSELILNKDGSIYHLNLLPEDISDTVILVGDPGRVDRVSRHFETLEVSKQKREFITHTGRYKGKRMTVLSTGIGTDNIDIVLNEIDALANIDFKVRKEHKNKKIINFIRIGTSGTIQDDIPVDSFLLSELALGFDSVVYYYSGMAGRQPEMESALLKHLHWDSNKSRPYVVKGDETLVQHFRGEGVVQGFTGSNVGFYGPQGRFLRLQPAEAGLFDKLSSFSYQGRRLTNFEMETSALYGLSALLGHRAISLNAIIANRATIAFSEDPGRTVDRLIQWTLEKLVQL